MKGSQCKRPGCPLQNSPDWVLQVGAGWVRLVLGLRGHSRRAEDLVKQLQGPLGLQEGQKLVLRGGEEGQILLIRRGRG